MFAADQPHTYHVCTELYTHHISGQNQSWCSRGSCYGVKLNGGVVEQEEKTGEDSSELPKRLVYSRKSDWLVKSSEFKQWWHLARQAFSRGKLQWDISISRVFSLVTDEDPRDQNISLQFTPLAMWLLNNTLVQNQSCYWELNCRLFQLKTLCQLFPRWVV